MYYLVATFPGFLFCISAHPAHHRTDPAQSALPSAPACSKWRHTGGQRAASATATAQADPYLSGYDSWLSTISLSRKLNRDWTALVRNYYLLNDFGSSAAKRYENRFQLGFAYRDIDTNRVNTLFRYEYWRRRDPVLQAAADASAQLLSDG